MVLPFFTEPIERINTIVGEFLPAAKMLSGQYQGAF